MTPTPTGCEQVSTAAVVPWQVVYPDDEKFPPDDVTESEGTVTVQPSLPYIANKLMALGGLRSTNREARATIKTCETAITGKFEIEIDAPGATVPKYESQEFTVPVFTTRVFKFDSRFFGVPTDIPFNSVADIVRWTPREYFKVGPVSGPTIGIIKVKFAGTQIGETKFTIVPSKNLVILWKALPLGGDFKIAKDRLLSTSNNREMGIPAFTIKTNFPVEDPKFFTLSSGMPAEWPATKNVRLVDWLNMDLINRQVKLDEFSTQWSLAEKRGSVSHILFVVQDNLLGLGAEAADGQANLKKVAYIEEDAGEGTEAHEIGHLQPWSLAHDYDTDPPKGKVTQGYLVTNYEKNFITERPTLTAPQSYSMMGCCVGFNQIMIRKDQYKTLLQYMAGEGAIDPPVWMLRGTLTVTGGVSTSFEAMPIYHFDAYADQDETCTGNPQCVTLKVKLTLQDDSIVAKDLAVSTAPLHADNTGNEITLDSHGVTHAFELPGQGVKKIRVEDSSNNLLFEKTVSAHAPTLSIDSVDVNNKKIEVKTKSDDIDGDTLYASFFIAPEGGNADGALLDEQLHGKTNKFTTNTVLSPGNYKAIIMVTDGFNTVQAEKQFSVAAPLFTFQNLLSTLTNDAQSGVEPITT